MLRGRGGRVKKQEHDEQVLAISRIVDQVA
jgi:hypothetical protein